MWRTYDGMGALLDEAVLKAFPSEERAVGERHFCEEHPSKKQATPHTCFGKYCEARQAIRLMLEIDINDTAQKSA